MVVKNSTREWQVEVTVNGESCYVSDWSDDNIQKLLAYTESVKHDCSYNSMGVCTVCVKDLYRD